MFDRQLGLIVFTSVSRPTVILIENSQRLSTLELIARGVGSALMSVRDKERKTSGL